MLKPIALPLATSDHFFWGKTINAAKVSKTELTNHRFLTAPRLGNFHFAVVGDMNNLGSFHKGPGA